jgi:predicted O-methyltransferase YrrM
LNHFFAAWQKIRHWLRSKGPNAVHSPFVFSFYNEVIAFPYTFYSFAEIEDARELLLKDTDVLEFTDAGSWKRAVKTKVADHARSSLMPPGKAQLLFRFVHWFKPGSILELGTSFGITTAYLQKAYPARVTSVEAIPAIAGKARQTWNRLQLDHIDSIIGKSENVLPNWLKSSTVMPDLVIVDANHQYAATMANFHLLEAHLGDHACLVFDDLYWSPDMTRAWKEICAHPRVTVSIDLYDLGFVFFRKENRKQHFDLRW